MADKTNETTATAAKSSTGGITKHELIRRALQDLGPTAMPVEIQAHIKSKYKEDVTTNHISAAKTEIVRKMLGGAKPAPAKAAKKKGAKKPAAKKPAAPAATPAAATANNGKGTGHLGATDAHTIKLLLGRIGASNLKTWIDVLAK